MFEHFDRISMLIMYRALVAHVKSNDGYGFHNNDQGHLAYVGGRYGESNDGEFGDTPEDNELYQMMKDLANRIERSDDIPEEDMVRTWQDFCAMAHDAYIEHKKRQGRE